MSEILVIGSLAYDSIETPKGKVKKTLGGSANYFSVAASFFSKVSIVGVVGQDYEDSSVELLKGRGVNLEGLQIKKGQTFHWEGSYVKDLNEAETLKTELNVFESFDPEVPVALKKTPFVFCANIAPELQLKVLDQCSDPQLIGMDTMNFWISSKKNKLEEVMKRVGVILINESEAKSLTDSAHAIEAAPQLLNYGPKAVVIKRGEYGYVLFTKESGYHILPAYPILNVCDPTGAGDSFAGAFFGYLASLKRPIQDRDFRKACIYGTVTASFTVEDFGLERLRSLTREDIETRVLDFEKIIQF